MSKKRYGLINLKDKSHLETPVKKLAIFNDEDDDEDDGRPQIGPNKPPGPTVNLKVKKQTLIDMGKALTEDPSIFEYDNIYDDMKKQKESAAEQKKAAKESRYIGKLIKFSDVRKKEQEMRMERKIQVEREEEGDQFKDKEEYVTSAYKMKLLEMEEANRKEEIEKRLEDMMDVRKQADMTGFYKHLLNQSIGEEKVPDRHETSEASSTTDNKSKFKVVAEKRQRNLRQRHSSSETSSGEEENLPRSSKMTEPPLQQSKSRNDVDVSPRRKSISSNEDHTKNDENVIDQSGEEAASGANEEALDATDVEANKLTKEDKIKLLLQKFEKRTVNEAFEAARLRYLARKEHRA